MLLSVDRVLLLKSVEIFSQIPDEVLGDLVALLEEESYSAGVEIIKNGDIGNFMYIIQAGKAEIHNGYTVYAEVGKNDIFGELSLLNPMPRTASVTSKTEIYLLKLKREPFIELLAHETEVMKSVLKMLTKIITSQNQKIIDLENQIKELS